MYRINITCDITYIEINKYLCIVYESSLEEINYNPPLLYHIV